MVENVMYRYTYPYEQYLFRYIQYTTVIGKCDEPTGPVTFRQDPNLLPIVV